MKTKLHLTITALSFMLGTAFTLPANAQAKPAADTKLDRTVLPIAEPKLAPITTLDARDAKAPPRFEVKAPQGAPNVVIVLIDDIGFGSSSAFGGPINMPTLEKLAAGGLKYNRFHTTALCSPTRKACTSLKALTHPSQSNIDSNSCLEAERGSPFTPAISRKSFVASLLGMSRCICRKVISSPSPQPAWHFQRHSPVPFFQTENELW